jgi:hypothetical protein
METDCFVGPAGFEPTHTEPKSVVLPLDDGPMFFSERPDLVIGSAKINILQSFASGKEGRELGKKNTI